MNQVAYQAYTSPIPHEQRTPMRRRELLAIAERDWSEPTFESGDIVLLVEMDNALFEALSTIARRNGIDIQVQGMYLLAFRK